MARLIELADRMGIERLVIYMGEPLVVDPSPDELRRQNDQVLQALSHWHHRAFGFVYVSPKHVEASLREIDRCVRDGPMVGLKLWVAARCDCPEADALVRRAARTEGGHLPAHLDQGRRQRAGRIDADGPGRAGGPASPRPRSSAATPAASGSWASGPSAPCRTWRSTWRGPIRRPASSRWPCASWARAGSLYGSDVPGRSFASQLAKVFGAEITDADRRLILGENLRRLLTPILDAKGVKP